MICIRASHTAVTTSGLREWTKIFCSVRANRRRSRQLSGPSVVTNNWKFAPDLPRES